MVLIHQYIMSVNGFDTSVPPVSGWFDTSVMLYLLFLDGFDTSVMPYLMSLEGFDTSLPNFS